MRTMRQSPMDDISVIGRKCAYERDLRTPGYLPPTRIPGSCCLSAPSQDLEMTIVTMLDITNRVEPFSSTSVWRPRPKRDRKK